MSRSYRVLTTALWSWGRNVCAGEWVSLLHTYVHVVSSTYSAGDCALGTRFSHEVCTRVVWLYSSTLDVQISLHCPSSKTDHITRIPNIPYICTLEYISVHTSTRASIFTSGPCAIFPYPGTACLLWPTDVTVAGELKTEGGETPRTDGTSRVEYR